MLTKTRTAAFARHYGEMVVVMFAGMLVLGLPGEAALHAIGSGTSSHVCPLSAERMAKH